MQDYRFLHALTRVLASLCRCNRGNVAMTFALAVVPVVGLVGAAVDYSRANAVKAAMQDALDATALMISKTASSQTPAQLATSATNDFLALFTRANMVTGTTVTTSYTTTNGSAVALTSTAQMPTHFMGLMGQSKMTISVSSTAKWGNARLRVALVLDNTGSMADDGKIGALQTATNNLITQLKGAATNNGDVYVSIVPFAKDVNIGANNYAASYIDWTSWNSTNQTCSGYGYSRNCSAASHTTWNGCVTDRGNTSSPSSANYDENTTTPNSSITASLFPAEQYSACPQQIMGLSYDWNNMTNVVNGMTPNGATNQPIGLIWGWMTLTGGGPFTAPAMDPNYTYSQVIILLTDGLNTQDRWYGNGSSTSTQVDSRMYNSSDGSGACANIKAAGITIYTVQVNTEGDPTSTLLQNCASDSSKFFLLTSASQIVTTFNAIGTNLTKLRIAN